MEGRMMVKGTEDKCKAFTIDFTWYHSAAGRIGSIVKTNDEMIILNLIVDEDRIQQISRWADEFGLIVL